MKKLFLLLSVIALFHTADAAGAKTKLLEPTPENCVYYSVEDLITKYLGIAEPGTTDTQVFNKLNALGHALLGMYQRSERYDAALYVL